ncbi:protein kinase [Actinomadura sp. 9N407]|uniref:protein kinase domain-containing protein n=1 Tax=Actinomadura sp. 9N407 TaxID=3375154 RepID=UPI0037A8E7C4
MTAAVTLTLVPGAQDGAAEPVEYVFTERTTCVIGRAADCEPRLRGDQRVSRHHCLLDINPPQARIRDFGSLNGTHVNGRKIGQRAEGQTPEEGARLSFPEHDLADGDEIEIGETALRVSIQAPRTNVLAHCARCGEQAEGGGDLCQGCREEDPAAVVELLLKRADSGADGLDPITGFTLLRELGRGGMGVVHLARHEATGREVALKLMLPKAAANETSRRRFLHEVALNRVLRHPHITELYDAGFGGGAFYFTIEYCRGGSLDKRRRLPVDEAVSLIRQVLEGLEHAHDNGVVHRDLSPSNILLDDTGTAKVSDFGLAKAFDANGLSGLTRTGATAGKPYFIPRQQVVNFRDATPAVDVWAAAACLYVMLTGRPPRRFPAGKDPWLQILQSEPVPIRERAQRLPSGLAEVIGHALTERPQIGFQTARELRQALEPY